MYLYIINTTPKVYYIILYTLTPYILGSAKGSLRSIFNSPITEDFQANSIYRLPEMPYRTVIGYPTLTYRIHTHTRGVHNHLSHTRTHTRTHAHTCISITNRHIGTAVLRCCIRYGYVNVDYCVYTI